MHTKFGMIWTYSELCSGQGNPDAAATTESNPYYYVTFSGDTKTIWFLFVYGFTLISTSFWSYLDSRSIKLAYRNSDTTAGHVDLLAKTLFVLVHDPERHLMLLFRSD